MSEKKANPRAGRGEDTRRESGEPGGGTGRRDEVGQSGVYPMSGGLPPGKHPQIRTPASWGQGDRGAEGYEDSGRSGLVWKDGQLLGGMEGADHPARLGDAPDDAKTESDEKKGSSRSDDE